MIEQLMELLEMQRAFDEKIMKEMELTEYPESSMKVALFVELGELMNEFPSKFKVWKKEPIDHRELGLIEYADVLHFTLSLFNQLEANSEGMVTLFEEDVYKECSNIKWNRCTIYLEAIAIDLSNDEYVDLLYDVFALGNELGFMWEEVYRAYKEKNAVNNYRFINEFE